MKPRVILPACSSLDGMNQIPDCRCTNCDADHLVQLEDLRAPTQDEHDNYPTVRRTAVTMVARCRCDVCGKEGLYVPEADTAPLRTTA
jgi:hypothetical protein